jgi:hypothetical protein
MTLGPSDPGVIVAKPIYAGNAPPATIDERRRALVGFALGAFRLDDLVLNIIGRESMPLGIHAYLYDDGDDIDRSPLAVSSSHRAPGAAPPR